MWGAQEKSEGAHQKIFGRRRHCAPHLQIASDATEWIETDTSRGAAKHGE